MADTVRQNKKLKIKNNHKILFPMVLLRLSIFKFLLNDDFNFYMYTDIFDVFWWQSM